MSAESRLDTDINRNAAVLELLSCQEYHADANRDNKARVDYCCRLGLHWTRDLHDPLCNFLTCLPCQEKSGEASPNWSLPVKVQNPFADEISRFPWKCFMHFRLFSIPTSWQKVWNTPGWRKQICSSDPYCPMICEAKETQDSEWISEIGNSAKEYLQGLSMNHWKAVLSNLGLNQGFSPVMRLWAKPAVQKMLLCKPKDIRPWYRWFSLLCL